jgi:ethanolamine permease
LHLREIVASSSRSAHDRAERLYRPVKVGRRGSLYALRMNDTSSGLQSGTLTWTKVASLGVAIAISGNFSGWNYGLGVGGLGGMFIAALAMALLFFCLTQCLAEIAAALPGEAGFDSYARYAIGPTAGYLCGISVAVALAVGGGLALSFIEAYASASFGLHGWLVKVVLMAVVLGFQLRGARDAVSSSMIIGALALAVLAVFCAFVAPSLRVANWFARETIALDAFLPTGIGGALQSVPYALFLFLGVEQAAHAASEMKDMSASLPKALGAAICIAAAIGLSVLLLATGSIGAEKLAPSNDPLLTVLAEHPARSGNTLMTHLIGVGALLSLIATFFSLVYAGSRQFYHLAHAGDLPRWLAHTTRRHAPDRALLLVAAIGLGAAAFPPDAVMVVFIFLISVSHLLIIASFILLRRRHPELARPYRARGGQPITWIGAALSCLVAASCYWLQTRALTYSIAALIACVVVFRLVRSNRGRTLAATCAHPRAEGGHR